MRPPYPPLADRLEQFASYRAKTTGSELFYNYLGCTLTEGAQLAADLFRCWWLLDIIASVQPQLRNSQPFQCWAVTRDGDGCQVIADDGNGELVYRQRVPLTDLPTELMVGGSHELALWCEGGTVMLPKER